MKTRNLFRLLIVFAVLTVFLVFEAQPVAAAPQPPIPTSPAEGSTIVTPTFSWEASAGAAKYDVEVGPQSDPNTVSWSAQTVNLTLTPYNPADFPNAPFYWRVRAKDSADVAGLWSSKINFTKAIPAPNPISPFNAHPNIHVPTFEWQAVNGAAYYKVEMSTSPTFVPVEASYTTSNTHTTPVNTISHGTHYWRVSGVDAYGHVGTPSAGWSFTKTTDAPVLVSPAVNASITIPTLEWEEVDGAAYYKVELSTSSTFVPVNATYTTYNIQITPVDALALNTYYWRVSGVDADGHVGENNWRKFTLIAPQPATDIVPQLLTPADTETITTDPTFLWSQVVGAHHYRLVISTNPSFSTTYDDILTDYTSYTPSIAESPDAYPNGIYYWRVEARTISGGVIATSAARSFTKQESLPLISPADGASLTVDPTFLWSEIVGAHHYYLLVSTNPNFSTTYDYILTDYNTYTPYSPAGRATYAFGTYYWKVEARTPNGIPITTSDAWTFTIGLRKLYLPLLLR
jgi:hypothetical protein